MSSRRRRRGEKDEDEDSSGPERSGTVSRDDGSKRRRMDSEAEEDQNPQPEILPIDKNSFQPGAIMDCVGGSECIGLADQYVSIVGDKTSRASLGGSALYLISPTMCLRWLLG